MEENSLLNTQVKNYQAKTDLLLKTDSIRVSQLNNCNYLNESYATQIEEMNAAIRKKERAIICWKIGGITVSAALVLFLLLK